MTADPYKRDRRLGRWRLTRKAQEDYAGDYLLQRIQDSVLILRAVPAMLSDEIEFLGRGAQFDVVGEGEIVPTYLPYVHGDGSVEWRKI